MIRFTLDCLELQGEPSSKVMLQDVVGLCIMWRAHVEFGTGVSSKIDEGKFS